jgi:hypothetical protein
MYFAMTVSVVAADVKACCPNKVQREIESGRGPSGLAMPHFTTLPRLSKARTNSARFWSAAVLCRYRTALINHSQDASRYGFGPHAL